MAGGEMVSDEVRITFEFEAIEAVAWGAPVVSLRARPMTTTILLQTPGATTLAFEVAAISPSSQSIGGFVSHVSAPMVVSRPWPGNTRVSPGNVARRNSDARNAVALLSDKS
jgi:hypothetical protein